MVGRKGLTILRLVRFLPVFFGLRCRVLRAGGGVIGFFYELCRLCVVYIPAVVENVLKEGEYIG